MSLIQRTKSRTKCRPGSRIAALEERSAVLSRVWRDLMQEGGALSGTRRMPSPLRVDTETLDSPFLFSAELDARRTADFHKRLADDVLWVPANAAGSDTMRDAAAKMFGVPPEDVTPDQRSRAKDALWMRNYSTPPDEMRAYYAGLSPKPMTLLKQRERRGDEIQVKLDFNATETGRLPSTPNKSAEPRDENS